MRVFCRLSITALPLILLLLLPVAAEAQNGGLRYTITVAEFDNRSNWRGQWHLGHAWAKIMTSKLAESGHFIVIAGTGMREAALDEQDLAASGLAAQGKKAPVSGHLTPAQLLLQGTITHASLDSGGKSGGLSIGGIRLGGKKQKAEVGATISLIDTTTGQVVASTQVEGVAKSRGGRIQFSDGSTSLDISGGKDDSLVNAMSEAAAQSIDWLVAQLDYVQWSGTVVLAQNGEVVVDRGTREGVRPGQVFRVGTSEILRSPDTGEILDERLELIAEVEVTRVKPKVSYCKVLSGDSEAISKGQSVLP